MTPASSTDPYNLERFVSAQGATFARARAELIQGRKMTHWMWFIFPQMAGLGSSEMSRLYAIGSIDEARAYLAHPLLGARYRECVSIVQDLVGSTAEAVFGPVDAAKFRSSLSLFSAAMPDDSLLKAALQRWFRVEVDPTTVALLARIL